MKYLFFPYLLEQKLKNIQLAIFDIDGVFTDGQLYYGENGESLKAFNTLDGHGIKMLIRNDIKVIVISGKSSKMLETRMSDLGIQEFYTGVSYKMPIYEQILAKYNIAKEQICYMGDDVPDYAILENCGLSVCPLNSHELILNICDWVIDKIGGNGAVRKLCDAIIIAKFGINALYIQEKT